MAGNVGLSSTKTLVWTRVTQDLRNGRPLEMLSIAKPIKMKELLYQILLLMLNLRHIFLFTVFLPDIAALPHFFGKCRNIISPRGPKGAKKENKKRQDAVGALFPASFLPCTSRLRGRHSGRLAW